MKERINKLIEISEELCCNNYTGELRRFNAEIDELKRATTEGKQWLIELEKKEDLQPLIHRMKQRNFYGEYLNDKPNLFEFLV